MAVLNILPTKNLSYNDIRDTLNANGGSVNNSAQTAFKENANLNWTSKHKPVDLSLNFCQDFNPDKPNYNATWWKSRSGNCGLVPKKIDKYVDAPSNYDGDMNGWTYLLPHGNANSPYRLGDFAHYVTEVKPPIRNFGGTGKAANSSQTNKAVFSAMVPIIADNEHVHVSEIQDLKDRHFGVYMKQDNGERYVRVFADGIIGDNNVTVEVKTYGLPIGTYTVYPLAARNAMSQDQSDIANDYLTLPGLDKFKIEIVETMVQVHIQSMVNVGAKSVSYIVSVDNDAAASLSLTNNYITLRYPDKDYESPLVANEQRIKLEDTTVNKGVTVIARGFFTNVHSDLLKECKVMCTLATGTYRGYVIPGRDIEQI